MMVKKNNGSLEPLNTSKINSSLIWAAGKKYKHLVPIIELSSKIHFFDGIETSFIHDIMIKTTRDLADLKNIGMDYIAKNLMIQKLYKDVNRSTEPLSLMEILTRGVRLGIYNKKLVTSFTEEEHALLNKSIDYSRDFNFTSSGLEAQLSKYTKYHDGKPIELPQHMFMLIAMDAFGDYHIDRMDYIIKLYDALSLFHITLPTPEVNALRTTSTNYASCVLLKIGDNLGSWNEASTALVLHTSTDAGIGADVSALSSIGDLVKNGKINHGGKVPELKSIDSDIQKTTQNGRRGAATAFLNFYDPEIIRILSLKSPRTEVAKRINDLSYGIKLRELVYERAQLKQLISLFSNRIAPELYEVFHSGTSLEFKELYEKLESEEKYYEQIDARYFLDCLEIECVENSSYYIMNVDEVNANKPYTETIYQSNICMEEVSPTKDISSNRPNDPDIAICVLGNINQGLVSIDKLAETTDLLARLQTHIMVRQKHPMPQANAYVQQYRSIGIGFSNHAYWLASQSLRYGSQEAMDKHDEWMEHFQFGLITASMNLAKEIGPAPRFFKYSTYAQGIMPIDRYKKTVDELTSRPYSCNWNGLRKEVMINGMANVALSMVPPSESSSVPSNQTSGLEPIKAPLTFKETKSGINKQFAPDIMNLIQNYDYAYDTKDMTKRYLYHVAISQKWLCKSISANRFYNPELYYDGKIPLKQVRKDLFTAKKFGVKTLYYTNTYVEDVEEKEGGCGGDSGCSV